MGLGIGTADPRTFIQGWSVPSQGTYGLLANVFIANSPQPILSMIYYTYNGLLTCFLLAVEWNGFAGTRKGLRVTTAPRGSQRSSYTLQLPKRWALPIMSCSALLHWLVSQSLFLVSIRFDEGFDPVNRAQMAAGSSNLYVNEYSSDTVMDYITCGYSPSAMLCTISLSIAMCVFAIVVSRRSFKSLEMPVVGSCSAAISAACHLPAPPEALPIRPLAVSPGNLSSSILSPSHQDPYGSQFSQHPSNYFPASFRGSGPTGEVESEALLSQPAPMSLSDPYKTTSRQSLHSMRSFETGYDSAYTGAFDAKDTGPEDGAETALLPVKWGVSGEASSAVAWVDENQVPVRRRVGHCSFSARNVEAPIEGELYAGL
jgi:hypothetical protein